MTNEDAAKIAAELSKNPEVLKRVISAASHIIINDLKKDIEGTKSEILQEVRSGMGEGAKSISDTYRDKLRTDTIDWCNKQHSNFLEQIQKKINTQVTEIEDYTLGQMVKNQINAVVSKLIMDKFGSKRFSFSISDLLNDD